LLSIVDDIKADGVKTYDERHAFGIQATDSGSVSLTEGNSDLEDIPPCLQGVTREEMEMVFLGTGSSQPSKYRNVSAIYLHLFERGGVMLDCGEGTYAQLKRRYSIAPLGSFTLSFPSKLYELNSDSATSELINYVLERHVRLWSSMKNLLNCFGHYYDFPSGAGMEQELMTYWRVLNLCGYLTFTRIITRGLPEFSLFEGPY
jgi:hypothetical protein